MAINTIIYYHMILAMIWPFYPSSAHFITILCPYIAVGQAPPVVPAAPHRLQVAWDGPAAVAMAFPRNPGEKKTNRWCRDLSECVPKQMIYIDLWSMDVLPQTNCFNNVFIVLTPHRWSVSRVSQTPELTALWETLRSSERSWTRPREAEAAVYYTKNWGKVKHVQLLNLRLIFLFDMEKPGETRSNSQSSTRNRNPSSKANSMVLGWLGCDSESPMSQELGLDTDVSFIRCLEDHLRMEGICRSC